MVNLPAGDSYKKWHNLGLRNLTTGKWRESSKNRVYLQFWLCRGGLCGRWRAWWWGIRSLGGVVSLRRRARCAASCAHHAPISLLQIPGIALEYQLRRFRKTSLALISFAYPHGNA